MKRVAMVVAGLILGGVVAAQQATAPSWDAWKFLLGDWVGEEGGGTPGQASGGGSTLKTDLDGRVLVRTNRVVIG